MEPDKDQSAENLGETSGSDRPDTEPASAGAAGTPSMQSNATAPADHTVEQLPPPEAYGNVTQAAPNMPAVSVTTKQRGGKKKLLLAAGVGLITLLLAGAAVFGLYLPNTQSNVWNTGLNRSGKALDNLVQTATTDDKLRAYEAADIRGKLTANAGGVNYSGTLNAAYDKKGLDTELKVTLGSGASQAINAKVLGQIAQDGTYPDLYLQLTGLKALGVDAFVPGVSVYDGKWIKIDSGYLKSIGESYVPGSDSAASSHLTASDAAEMARAAAGVTKGYVFSTAADKAVFIKKSFVGKEQVDGVNSYHYKASVNAQHLQAYCTALSNAVLSTNGYKSHSGLTSTQLSDAKTNATKSCNSLSEQVKHGDTVDVWIDSHYKLIYKIRTYEQGGTASYTDIGQLYKGGDKLSLFVAFHSAPSNSDGKLTLDTDLQASTAKMTLALKQTGGKAPYNLTATLSAAASKKPVQITVPATATPVQDVLKQFTLGGSTEPPVGGATNALGGTTGSNLFRNL